MGLLVSLTKGAYRCGVRFLGRKRSCWLLAMALIAVPGVFVSAPVFAQTVQQLVQFSFGTIALRSNLAKERLALNLDGTYSATSNLLVIEGPQLAEFLVSGLQPSTALSLSIAAIQLSQDGLGGGKKFDVTFVYLPNVSTDATGSTTIRVGGTLQTSGDGTAYSDFQYGGSASVIVNY